MSETTLTKEDIENSMKDSLEDLLEDIPIEGKVIHAKIVRSYSSIEFDYEINLLELEYSLDNFFEIFNAIYDRMPKEEAENVSKAPLATDKQKEIMDKFNIPYNKKTTQEEAGLLIEKSIKEAKSGK